jgi:hypothetical protein
MPHRIGATRQRHDRVFALVLAAFHDQRLERVAALHDAPPGGHLIGIGKDRGSNSGINGYAPEIVAIFATDQDVSVIADYYRAHYPQYHLHTDFPRSPGTVQMVGLDGPPISDPPSIDTAVIGVDIDPGSPYNDTHVKIRIPSPGQQDKTYVVVGAQGSGY